MLPALIRRAAQAVGETRGSSSTHGKPLEPANAAAASDSMATGGSNVQLAPTARRRAAKGSTTSASADPANANANVSISPASVNARRAKARPTPPPPANMLEVPGLDDDGVQSVFSPSPSATTPSRSPSRSPPPSNHPAILVQLRSAPEAWVVLLTAARMLCRDAALTARVSLTLADIAALVGLLQAALEVRAAPRAPPPVPLALSEAAVTEALSVLQKLACVSTHRNMLVQAGAAAAALAALAEEDDAAVQQGALRLLLALAVHDGARESLASTGVPAMALSLMETPASPLRWEAAALLAELCRGRTGGSKAGCNAAAMLGAVRACADILGNARDADLHLPAAQLLESLSEEHSEKLRAAGCLPLLAMHLAAGWITLDSSEGGAERAAKGGTEAAAEVSATATATVPTLALQAPPTEPAEPGSRRAPSADMARLAAAMDAAVITPSNGSNRAKRPRAAAAAAAGASAGGATLTGDDELSWRVNVDRIVAGRRMLTTVCAALTSMARFEINSVQIQECNVIFQAARYVALVDPPPAVREVQLYALRLLRFLFSLERNRRHFKRLFPPRLFAAFIDVGHYVFDLKKYQPLVSAVVSLDDADRRRLQRAIVVRVEMSNQNIKGRPG